MKIIQHDLYCSQLQHVLTSGGIIKQAIPGQTLPPGHIFVSSNGQLIMASAGSVMAPPPPKINSMPPLSVSPMVTNVTGTVSQVIPAVAQQVIGQPTVLVNTIQTPVIIQPNGVMTVDNLGQNVQIPHLTVAGNVLHSNAQQILDQQQGNVTIANQNLVSFCMLRVMTFKNNCEKQVKETFCINYTFYTKI